MNKRGLQWLIAAMLVCFGAAYAFVQLRPRLPSLVTMDQSSVVASAPSVPVREKDWEYFVTIDPLLGDETTHAKVVGSGPEPNSPPGAASLDLAQSDQYGKSVTVIFPKVKEACTANPCEISLSWDEAPPDPYRFRDISDDKKTKLKLDDLAEYDRFMDALARARQLKVVAELGMPQDYVLTFPVDGLDVKRTTGKPGTPPPDAPLPPATAN